MKAPKIENGRAKYHFEDDIFSAQPLKRKYDSSFQIGDLIFDLDKKGRINGIEIMNASRLFYIPKVFLKNMISGKLRLEVNDKSLKLIIFIRALIRNAERVSTLSIERVRPEFLSPTRLNLAVAKPV